MLNQIDKHRQKRHRKRLEAKIDAAALVVGISCECFNPQLFNLIIAMLEELPAQVRSKIHLYGIDSGNCKSAFKNLGDKILSDYGVPLYYTAIEQQKDLSNHYFAIDILLVSEDNEQGLTAAKSALSFGGVVVAKSKLAAKINLNLKDRLRISDKQCAMELSKHIVALSTQRRKFDCALAS